jgi:hypothetical protein
MRKWRNCERDLGASITESLLAQGFSEADIAEWGPEAWDWVDAETVDRLLYEIAEHFGDTIVTCFLIKATRTQRGQEG